MFKNVSEKIASFLTDNRIISKEDKILYSYGLRQIFMMTLNVFIMIILGLILQELWQSILFSVAYIPLRSFAGGFHASTPQRCTIVSTGMVLIALLIMKFIPISKMVIVIMLMVSTIIIVYLSPVQDKHKTLDDLEKIVYKRKTISILIIEVLFTIITLSFNLKVSYCITLSLMALSVMLILGKIKFYLSQRV